MLYQGVLSSVLESVGISLFTMEVLSESPPFVTVWVMNGIFFVPILAHVIRNFRDGGSSRKCIMIVMVVAFVLELVGIGLTCVFELTAYGLNRNIKEAWEIPVSLLCVSIAWTPYLQQQQLFPTAKTLNDLLRKKPVLKCRDPVGTSVPRMENSSGTSGLGSLPDTRTSTRTTSLLSDDNCELSAQSMAWLVFTYPQLSARWKNGILQNSLKIVLIPSMCILYGHLFHIIEVGRLGAGLHNITPAHINFTSFLCSILCSLGGYLLGWVACTICLQKQCFALPLTLATPLCLLLTMLSDFCVLPGHGGPHGCAQLHLYTLEIIIPAALCLVAAQILSTAVFIFQTQTIVMQLESHVSHVILGPNATVMTVIGKLRY